MKIDKRINHQLEAIKPSGIGLFFEIANETPDAISLGIGEPDFQTPWHIRQAGIEALTQGKTWYTSTKGIVELRSEIAQYFLRRFNLTYNPQYEILVTVGASEAIEMAIKTLLNEGDEVCVVQPSYVCYSPMIAMAKAKLVMINTVFEEQFRLTPQLLLEKLTPKTRMLILPYPSNPTGAIMERSDLEKIAEILRDRDIIVISDEIYAELTYNQQPHVSIASLPDMWERTLVINGFSKAYAMTGWRIGYACGPRWIIDALTKYHQYAIMCAPTISQFAALEALRHGDDDIQHMKNEYDQRRRYIVNRLNKMGLPCFLPQGAFYVFPDISITGLSSFEFCEKLVKQAKVAVIPGDAFGECGEGHVRISYSYSLKHISEALDRIELFIKDYI